MIPPSAPAPLLQAEPARSAVRTAPHVRFLVLFSLLQLADVLTTNHALATGKAFEANPVMALAMVHLGAVWWLPKVVIVAFAILAVPRIRTRWPLNLVSGILMMMVAGNLLYW